MRILFVCTGNTCRSCMAHALAQRELKTADVRLVQVQSAGTVTVADQPASENAILVMKEMGIDIQGHRTTVLEKKLIDEADLILAMTDKHRREILRLSPDASKKVYTLKEYAGKEGDVVDPFGGSVEVYRETADELADLIQRSMDRLVMERKKRL